MEERNIARFPRPVHHHIPNFVNSEKASERLAQLPELTLAKCIKVNPDTSQRPVRYVVLAHGKTLLMPQPRLGTGFFSKIQMSQLPSTVSIDELEWGILTQQGNLEPESTLVVTTVHDEQVVTDIPAGSLTKHDVLVDVIITPTRLIRVPNRAPKHVAYVRACCHLKSLPKSES